MLLRRLAGIGCSERGAAVVPLPGDEFYHQLSLLSVFAQLGEFTEAGPITLTQPLADSIHVPLLISAAWEGRWLGFGYCAEHQNDLAAVTVQVSVLRGKPEHNLFSVKGNSHRC